MTHQDSLAGGGGMTPNAKDGTTPNAKNGPDNRVYADLSNRVAKIGTGAAAELIDAALAMADYFGECEDGPDCQLPECRLERAVQAYIEKVGK